MVGTENIIITSDTEFIQQVNNSKESVTLDFITERQDPKSHQLFLDFLNKRKCNKNSDYTHTSFQGGKYYIEDSDYVDGIVHHLGLKFENGDIKQCKTQKLRLIEPDNEELAVPNVTFASILNLPSTDFQKIIRDLSIISDKLEIKSVGNELIFKCQGQFAKAEIRRSESGGHMEFIQKDPNKIIQGEFSLKNLGYFIKCTNLCSQIEMYLENDLPLVVKYNVASLGEIKLCLAQLPPN